MSKDLISDVSVNNHQYYLNEKKRKLGTGKM